MRRDRFRSGTGRTKIFPRNIAGVAEQSLRPFPCIKRGYFLSPHIRTSRFLDQLLAPKFDTARRRRAEPQFTYIAEVGVQPLGIRIVSTPPKATSARAAFCMAFSPTPQSNSVMLPMVVNQLCAIAMHFSPRNPVWFLGSRPFNRSEFPLLSEIYPVSESPPVGGSHADPGIAHLLVVHVGVVDRHLQ